MLLLKRIYRRHIYGIMGTLVFHILIVGMFLVAEMDIKGKIREKEVWIEIPVELIEELTEKEEETGNLPSQENASSAVNIPSLVTNRPSARGALSKDRFFDEDYQREVEAAKKIVTDVNHQLSKEITAMDDIPMPVDNTEGKTREEISNVVYSGQSNIEYQLENRYHLRLPIPVYLARGGGVIVVDISVDRTGKVVAAKPRPGSGEDILEYARMAAMKTRFNPDPSAPAIQQGTIRYTFKAQ